MKPALYKGCCIKIFLKVVTTDVKFFTLYFAEWKIIHTFASGSQEPAI